MKLVPEHAAFFEEMLGYAISQAEAPRSKMAFDLMTLPIYAMYLAGCIDWTGLDLSGDDGEELVKEAIATCRARRAYSCREFLDEVENLLSSRVAPSKAKWNCAFFLMTTNLPSWLNGRKILDSRVCPADNWAQRRITSRARQECDLRDLKSEILDKAQLLRFQVKARNAPEALKKSYQTSLMVRGIHSLSANRRWTLLGERSIANEITPSPMYLVWRGTEGFQCGLDRNYEETLKTVSDQLPETSEFLLNLMATSPKINTPRYILQDAVESFAASGDSVGPYDEFLSLWHTVETLSLCVGGDTRKICSAIANYFNAGQQTIGQKLKVIAKVRNGLVHRGEYSTDSQAVTYELRGIAARVIVQFALLSKSLRTVDEFREVQSLMTVPPSQISNSRQSVKAVKKIRGIT